MRLLMINLLASALVLFSAGMASAYSLTLVNTSPDTILGGQFASYDVVMDIPVNDGLVLFSVSVTFDPNVIAYRQDLSVSNDYYPLYSPAAGKTPANWLNPNVGFGPDPYVPDGPGFDTWPAPPAGLGQINVDFLNPTFQATNGTATGLVLGSIVFEAVGPGTGLVNFSFDNGGNIFNINGTDESGSVVMGSGTDITVIPEPTTALLVGLGLVGLGVSGRRRA